MSKPIILIEEWSPVCDIQAFVEKNEQNYFFYLWINPGSDEARIKSCWICNAVPAKEEMDVKAMEMGIAPSMPASYVCHDINGIQLDGKKFRIVWFEEGDAAALLYEEEIICVIPGWSGYKGFHGYSKYAKGMGPFAWELTEALETLSERVEKSTKFWDYFETDYWESFQQQQMDTLENFFGTHQKYYVIDGGKFPPKALVSGKRDGVCYGITCGVSLIPMPCVEQHFEDEAEKFKRMELGFATIEKHESLCNMMYSVLSGLSAMPWKEITFLAHGHTIPFANIKGFSAILFLNPKLVSGMESPKYNLFMEEEINLLWVIPLTQDEYHFVMEYDVTKFLQKVKKDVSMIHIFDGESKFV